ncbi:hypothetical protein R3P38DRAFT_2584088 [Favolaschia claudopus]|uniref:Ubiquitin-like protease family profile domain-containing protein n=1 Tax=Favolaschia claudopus TaxID=2862362 RepID=A0AAV9Z8C2_9AGAR
MTRTKRSIRANQTASRLGFGVHHTSPIKLGDARKKTRVHVLGRAQQAAVVADELDALLRGETPSTTQAAGPCPVYDAATSSDVQMDAWVDEDPTPAPPFAPPAPPASSLPARSRSLFTEAAHARLYDAWVKLIPRLERPWAQYYERTYGQQRDPIPTTIIYSCTTPCGGPTTVHNVKCLYTTFIQDVSITTCSCKPVTILLLEHGVFPASPTKPKTGVACDLLDLYRALFERSCDAVTALAAALHTMYERRGFKVSSKEVCHLSLLISFIDMYQGDAHVADPFRRLLTQAVQWSSSLRVHLERKVDDALAAAALSLHPAVSNLPTPSLTAASAEAPMASAEASVEPSASIMSSSSAPPPPPPRSSPSSHSPMDEDLPSGSASAAPKPPPRAHRVLCERCPACFNLLQWGRSLLTDGGDVQLGGDACFSYVHPKSAGDGRILFKPKYFLPKATVDAVKRRLKAARKTPNANPKRRLPKEVIDSCEESWEAANEKKKKKANGDRYDASGVFVLTCRHGQVIFMANVDTPGEQQCYIIALLEEVLSMLPAEATVLQAYDVACITDHSLDLFPILLPSVRSRVSFVINGMHAYGHQWACQLVYSPRFRVGMGLADHECVERFWSRIRKLIPITRGQWNSRRIWMLDEYADFVANESRTALGNWIHRQQEKNLTLKYRTASKTFDECGVTDHELRNQWAAQKVAQTSIRAHAPARLRRELDKVLLLQTQIDAVEKAVEDTKKTLKDTKASQHTLSILSGLEVTREQLSTEAEALYGSLNIQDTFPELRELPLEFAQTLLALRDLKINIRKRATGSFMEWETLDRAVSGRREALGTKLHQTTRKAITKRQPALLKAIAKFNAGCATLEKLSPPNSSIPIPSPLSTQLNGLRNDPSLHEDVWITPSEGPIPRWLNDEDVRDGIRSLHVLDRCAEEVIRLNSERDNLKRWLVEEKNVVRRCIEMSDASDSDLSLSFFLSQREAELLALERLWTPFLRPRDIDGRFVTSSIASANTSARGVTRVTASAYPSVVASVTASTARSAHTAATQAATRTTSSTSHHDDPFLPIPRASPLSHSASAVTDEDDFFDEDDQVLIIEDVLDNSDDEDDIESSAVEASSDLLDVQWGFKSPHGIDATFIQQLHLRNNSLISTAGNFTHFVVRSHGRRPLSITVDDLRPFTSHTARITGFGINGVAASLLNIYRAPHSPVKASADQCAVLSTYDLGRVHFKGSDPDLWRTISPTEYWDKPLWVIPIFRAQQEHWVLAVVVIPSREILFFDSLASRGGWRQDLRDVMLLITRLVVLANRNNHPLHVSTEDPDENWSAHPLFKVGEPRQHNDYDCGVWVLSMMAAFMRGSQDVALTNDNIPWVRHVLRKHIETLPIS